MTMTTKNPRDPGAIAIRLGRREDVARVAELIMLGAAVLTRSTEEIAAEALHPDYLRAFEEVAASPANTLFVAELAGAVVGTFQITIIPGLAARGRRRAKIESVHVAPESRELGIGAIMMRHALAFAKERGVGLVELTSNKAREDAHRFYRNLGFDQSHEGFKIVP
jgi:ribosomal protein S18 acetylase RimI-like enzyme